MINSPEQLESGIAEMLAHDGPVLLDVWVRRDENCYPMVPPGKNNSQMIGLAEPVTKRPVEVVHCSNCGSDNKATHKFCSECGTKL